MQPVSIPKTAQHLDWRQGLAKTATFITRAALTGRPVKTKKKKGKKNMRKTKQKKDFGQEEGGGGGGGRQKRGKLRRRERRGLFVGWLLNVPATG